MSLGYVGYCKKICEDDEFAIYLYSGENWSDKNLKKEDATLFDGEITISKNCLEEPEIHTKIKKTASHKKKLVTKRITHSVDIQKYIVSGDIVINKKCKNEFKRFSFSEIDYISNMLLHKIFKEYQINGKLPEMTSFIQ